MPDSIRHDNSGCWSLVACGYAALWQPVQVVSGLPWWSAGIPSPPGAPTPAPPAWWQEEHASRPANGWGIAAGPAVFAGGAAAGGAGAGEADGGWLSVIVDSAWQPRQVSSARPLWSLGIPSPPGAPAPAAPG